MILNKKCIKCGKPATHKFVKIDKDQIYDMYYCEEHASEKSPYQKSKIPLTEILASFLNQEQGQIQEAVLGSGMRCAKCGLRFDLYRKTLMLGCPDCYNSFAEQLLPELRKFHGNIKHTGRRPGGGFAKPTESGKSIEIVSSFPAKPAPVTDEDAEQTGEAEEASAEEKQSASKGGAELITDPKEAIDELTREMQSAIANEDFEKAARCRDQIKELREKL